MITLYEILNVAETATPEEIKDAYRVMAMKWHPDRNINNRAVAEEKFKEIGAAYKVLYDPVQRRDYDQWVAGERRQSSQNSYSKAADMSGKDAENMFFESMLDLAMELARRGYDVSAITKALIALDCPEGVAKVAAISAVKFSRDGRSAENKSSKTQSTKPEKIVSVEDVKWIDIEPYYIATIGGVYADDRMDEDEYLVRLSKHKTQMKGYLNSFVLMLVGAVFTAIFIKNSPFLVFGVIISSLGFLGICGICIWRIFTSNKQFNREKTLRFYTTAFECYHNARPLPFRFQSWNIWAYLFNIYWLAYRRMTKYAVIAFLVVIPITIISYIGLMSNADWMWITYLSGYVFAISIGVVANKSYFKSCKKQIQKNLHLPREQALIQLRRCGGVSPWAAVGSLAIIILISLPATIKTLEMQQAEAAQVAKQQAEEIARKKAAEQAQATAVENKKLDALIADIEARYPVLNKTSPKYNQKIVEELVSIQKAYIAKGQPPSNALQMAVQDMTQPATPAQNSY